MVWGGWNGFKKGFVIELFTFLALFIGLYAGVHFSDFATRIITEDFGSESEYVPVIAFTITFLAVGAMVYFGGKAIEKVVKIVQLSLANKIAGLVLGVFKIAFFIGGLILITESMDQRKNVIDHKTKSGSLLYYPIKSMTVTTIPAFEESTMFIKKSLEDEGLITDLR
jgi:membrane protein required for colicin V production